MAARHMPEPSIARCIPLVERVARDHWRRHEKHRAGLTPRFGPFERQEDRVAFAPGRPRIAGDFVEHQTRRAPRRKLGRRFGAGQGNRSPVVAVRYKTDDERANPPCRSPCRRPLNGWLLNSGSSRSRANSTAAGRAVGATIKTGCPSWSRAPPSARPMAVLPDCAAARRQMIRPPRPAMSSTSRCQAIVRHGSAASRAGCDSQRSIRPGGVLLTRFRRVRGGAPAKRDRAVAFQFLPIAPGPLAAEFALLGGRYHPSRRPVTLKNSHTVRTSARNRPS